jgi:hypothetical protein
LPTHPEPGTLLKLNPENPAHPSIHLIARPAFRLGRSFFHADFITRFLPETSANNDLTNQLSRVHALAEVNGTQVTIRDGNGDTPSVNGTSLDDQPLESEQPSPLKSRALLTLGGVYSIEITPLVGQTPPPLKISNSGESREANARRTALGGAVFFFPTQRQPAVRHAVWLFSEAGFGIDFVQRIVWDLRGRGESPASFHYDRGCFWLGNRTLANDTLEVAGTALDPGEIAPLTGGQELRIGTLRFKVELA